MNYSSVNESLTQHTKHYELNKNRRLYIQITNIKIISTTIKKRLKQYYVQCHVYTSILCCSYYSIILKCILYFNQNLNTPRLLIYAKFFVHILIFILYYYALPTKLTSVIRFKIRFLKK